MPLAKCCEIVSGATPSTFVDDYWDGDIYWATPKDLSNLEGHYISDTPRKLTQAGLKSCTASVLPPNSVLFSSRAPIGHVAINTVPMATNQGFKSFIPKAGITDAKFLFHWLRANRSYLESLGNGATFKEVSKATVSKIEIPLPPLPEQRRIAAILDQADALRAKRREALALLDSLTQSIFIEMFGDPSAETSLFAKYPLQELLEDGFQNGAYFPKESYVENGVEMVHMSDAFNGIIKRGNLKRVSCNKSDIEKYSLTTEDIIIARRSLTYDGAARPCMVPKADESLIFESSFIRVRANKKRVTPLFLFHYLNNDRVREKFVRSYVTQSTISGINQLNLAQVPIVLPPVELQHEFNTRFTAIESVRKGFTESQIELDSLFASLHHRAFRGEL